MKTRFAAKWWFIPPLLIAAAIFASLYRSRTAPAKAPVSEAATPVRVVTVQRIPLKPRVRAFGSASPTHVWRAVSEVRGRVVYVHPDLRAGAIIQADAELLRIDPREYELAQARAKASLAQAQAQLSELSAREKNLAASLAIEQKALSIAANTLERRRQLVAANAGAQAEADAEHRKLLGQERTVQELRSSQELLPSQRTALQATVLVQQAAVQQAALDLSKLVLRAPFACRLAKVTLEPGQFVVAGQQLLEAHGTAQSEVEAQFAIRELRNLLAFEQRDALQPGLEMSRLRALFDVDASVRAESANANWPARFDRLRETLDLRTRAIPVVVVVDDPYRANQAPNHQPPLAPGMFCEVELLARKAQEVIVLPRSAMNGGQVFVVVDGRLVTRTVQVAFLQDDLACLSGGLESGDTILLSDPSLAIVGALVQPVPDDAMQARLEALAP
ncbi:MAG: multidrug efflux system membrane fusion protein [Rhodothermales bacterium]